MINYLDFKDARCKDCYKCLRECPVKAIKVVDHHAKIIESRCILCGHCTKVCPQNAKSVHTERAEVEKLLKTGKAIASVAPSFVSSFDVQDFNVMKLALGRLGFADAEETSVGAREVTAQYKKLLEEHTFKNFITSCCPAVNTMIELYYPKALSYLAPVDTPMIAHAKMIRKKRPDAKVVFIGPCIAKKREAHESGVVDGVLTFEDLAAMFENKGIVLSEIAHIPSKASGGVNRAKYYPISRGIIKSFENYIDGYEFVAVDGAEKCKEVLENIESLSGMFIEMNSCDSACVNGPCSLALKAGALKANADIRKYVSRDLAENQSVPYEEAKDIDFSCVHERKRTEDFVPTDRQINEILAKTGKTKHLLRKGVGGRQRLCEHRHVRAVHARPRGEHVLRNYSDKPQRHRAFGQRSQHHGDQRQGKGAVGHQRAGREGEGHIPLLQPDRIRARAERQEKYLQ